MLGKMPCCDDEGALVDVEVALLDEGVLLDEGALLDDGALDEEPLRPGGCGPAHHVCCPACTGTDGFPELG